MLYTEKQKTIKMQRAVDSIMALCIFELMLTILVILIDYISQYT